MCRVDDDREIYPPRIHAIKKIIRGAFGHLQCYAGKAFTCGLCQACIEQPACRGGRTDCYRAAGAGVGRGHFCTRLLDLTQNGVSSKLEFLTFGCQPDAACVAFHQDNAEFFLKGPHVSAECGLRNIRPRGGFAERSALGDAGKVL